MRATYTRVRAILNGAVSAAQVVVVSATLLLSYQMAVAQTNAAEFGLYSLFFTISMLTQIGSLGFGTGAAKHLASAWGAGRLHEVRPLIRVSLAVPFIGGLVAAGLIYAVLGLVTDLALDSDQQALAKDLRPAVLVAGALLPLSTAVQGLMDGASRSYVRGPVVMMGASAYLMAAWMLLPEHGVMALAWASIIQLTLVISVLIVYLFAITRHVQSSWLPSREVLRNITRYNLKIHFLALPTLAYDPLIKALLGGYAGLTAVAYFEIANRFLQQISALILAANQAVVPLVAVRNATGDLVPAEAFKRILRVVLVACLFCFAGAVLLLPLLGRFVFGADGDAVVEFGAILSVGWVLMCLSGPAYFIGVTIDNFRINLVSNYSLLVVIGVLGAGLGRVGGAMGVAAAVSIAYVLSSLLVNGQFIRRYGVSARDLVPARQQLLTLAYVVVVTTALLVGHGQGLRFVLATTAMSLLVVTGLGLLELAPVLKSIKGTERQVRA